MVPGPTKVLDRTGPRSLREGWFCCNACPWADDTRWDVLTILQGRRLLVVSYKLP